MTEKEWRELYERAKANSVREGKYDLIEIKAQRPLVNGKPGEEFKARLIEGIRVYESLGGMAKFYVPGSLHRGDSISLSEAGTKFLISKGIGRESVFGEEANRIFSDGVYNTQDECNVAVGLFLNGDFKRLHSVCSPNQILRAKLFYIQLGVIPFYHTVSTDEMFHDDIEEIFHELPKVLDGTWDGVRLKKEREVR